MLPPPPPPPPGSLRSGQRGRLSSAHTSSLSASPCSLGSAFLRELPLDLSAIVHGRELRQPRGGGRGDPSPPQMRSQLAIGGVLSAPVYIRLLALARRPRPAASLAWANANSAASTRFSIPCSNRVQAVDRNRNLCVCVCALSIFLRAFCRR